MERTDFELQWQRRQQAIHQVPAGIPTDEAILEMAQKAQQEAAKTVPMRRRYRWMPYAAAAGLLIGVVLFSWTKQNDASRMHVAKEVNVEGQTVRFLCNSGCSASEVFHSSHAILEL